MDNKLKNEKLAAALLRIGVNIQKGQTLLIQASTDALALVKEVTKQAFEFGAKDVIVHFEDAEIEHLRALNCSEETLLEVPMWKKESLNYYLKNNCVQMGISSTYPTLNDDVDSSKLLAQNKAKNELRNVVRKYIHQGTLKWTSTVQPNLNWAKKLYPELSENDAFLKLDKQICEMMRVDEHSSSINNWLEHCEKMAIISKKLNEYNFKSINIKTSIGTDITMDLVKNHIWTSAADMGSSMVDAPYVANMPTEEIFTNPDYRSVNGIAVASLPLMMSGKLVNNFSITFKDGEAIDCQASENVELLKDALFKNESTKRLGEVALVTKYSPIKKMNQIFYNGLIDENAACHLAFGSSFPSNIKNGIKMTKEELLANGVNVSTSHHDFMIGTNDINVIGITFDQKEITIMKDGEFVI